MKKTDNDLCFSQRGVVTKDSKPWLAGKWKFIIGGTTGAEIQTRINCLEAQEGKDLNDAIERYDSWKRRAHPSLFPIK